MGSAYDKTDHERCFALWYDKGESIRQIAKHEDLPTAMTIRKWAGDYDCPLPGCTAHNWKEKKKRLRREAEKNVRDELDLPDRRERERKQLRFIYRTQKRIQELIEESDLEEIDDLDEIGKVKTAIRLVKDLAEEKRLLKGEATQITENRGGQGGNLGLAKIIKNKYNVENISEDDEDEIIDAVEDSIIEGEVGENV